MKNKKYYLVLILNTIAIFSSSKLLHANEPIATKLKTLKAKLEELKQSLTKLKSSLTSLNDELTKVDKLIAEMGIKDIAAASVAEISEALGKLDDKKQAELAKRGTTENLYEDGSKEIRSTPSTLYSVLQELMNQKLTTLNSMEDLINLFTSLLSETSKNAAHAEILLAPYKTTITYRKENNQTISGFSSDLTELIKQLIISQRKNLKPQDIILLLNKFCGESEYKGILLKKPDVTPSNILANTQVVAILERYLILGKKTLPIEDITTCLNGLSEEIQNHLTEDRINNENIQYPPHLENLLIGYFKKQQLSSSIITQTLNKLNEKYKNCLIRVTQNPQDQEFFPSSIRSIITSLLEEREDWTWKSVQEISNNLDPIYKQGFTKKYNEITEIRMLLEKLLQTNKNADIVDALNGLDEVYQNTLTSKPANHENASGFANILYSFVNDNNFTSILNKLNENYKNELISSSNNRAPEIIKILTGLTAENIIDCFNKLDQQYQQALTHHKFFTLQVLKKHENYELIINNLNENYQELKNYAKE